MTHDDSLTIERILTEFLDQHPLPSRKDWIALIEANPNFAGDIADFELVNGYAEQLATNPGAEIDEQLVSRTLARALSELSRIDATDSRAVEVRLDAFRGPTAQRLAHDIGLKGQISLLNSVMFGRVLAPLKIVSRIAERVNASASDLMVVFARRFEETGQVAFKSIDRKPSAPSDPIPWDQAVRAEGLPSDDERELLALMDADDSL